MNRRDFLKAIGYSTAAGAAGVALSKLPEVPQEKPETIEINDGPTPGVYHLDSALTTSTSSVVSVKGFHLHPNGDAEFRDVRIRGHPSQAT